jgi:hypothetical protein
MLVGTPQVGVGAKAASFSPTDIAGLKLWLDAAKGITKTGASVTAWADQSGQGNDMPNNLTLTSPQAANGINGLPSVNFSGNQALGRTTSILAGGSARTVFAVVKLTAASDIVLLTRRGGSAYAIRFPLISGTRFRYYDDIAGGGDYFDPGAAISTVAHAFVVSSVAGAPPTIYWDGVLQANAGTVTNTGTETGNAGFVLGNYENGLGGGANSLAGDLGMLGLYDSQISGPNIASLSGYLRGKFGTP